MNKFEKVFFIIMAAVTIIAFGIMLLVSQFGAKAFWNTYDAELQKVDDATNYKTRKKVEDTARAMIANYEADKLTWQQYKDSENEEKRSWADQALMRANRTAAQYNNFYLENSFVWSGNIPKDIRTELEYLEDTE